MLKVESDGPLLRVDIARPEVRNALNEELIERLTGAFEGVNSQIRVIVLSGEGSAFCAGADLEWMRASADASEEENYRQAVKISRLFHSIARCPAVVIARVNGHCFGGGCGLLAAADIGIAVDNALFAFSEVRLGLVPATIGPMVMDKIGRGNARALFVTGEAFSAQRALIVGLVHEVTEKSSLDAAVEAKVKLILDAGPMAISTVKDMTQSPTLGSEDASRLLASVRSGAEAKEGIRAFLDKRKPDYSQGN